MKVLFVCTGNACRSPVAEALLKKFKPKINVDSAGTRAYYRIIEVARDYLRLQEAEQHLKDFPEDLESKKLGEYDLIVAMKPKHKEFILRRYPESDDKIIVWNIDDPYNLSAEHSTRIFNQIRQKTKVLANSL